MSPSTEQICNFQRHCAKKNCDIIDSSYPLAGPLLAHHSSLLHIWVLFFSSNLTHLRFILLLSFITYHCLFISCLLHICCNFVLLILHNNLIVPYIIYVNIIVASLVHIWSNFIQLDKFIIFCHISNITFHISHIITASLVHIWCSFLQRRMDWQPINPADQFNCKKLPSDEFFYRFPGKSWEVDVEKVRTLTFWLSSWSGGKFDQTGDVYILCLTAWPIWKLCFRKKTGS